MRVNPACQPRPFRVTTEADDHAAAGIPDLLERDFTAERPGMKFVGDITYSAKFVVMCPHGLKRIDDATRIQQRL